MAVVDDILQVSLERLERIDRALEAQRSYIKRVPDPDNRYRAETNLLTLLEMREASHRDLVEARQTAV